MVLPIIDEEARHKSMARCPLFGQCLSVLCPLDPALKYKVSVPGRPLCFWYLEAHRIENLDHFPPVVVNKLPIYIVHLLQSGVLKEYRAEIAA